GRLARTCTFRASADDRNHCGRARFPRDHAARASPVALASPYAGDLPFESDGCGRYPIPARVPSALLPAAVFPPAGLRVAGLGLRSVSPAPRLLHLHQLPAGVEPRYDVPTRCALPADAPRLPLPQPTARS